MLRYLLFVTIFPDHDIIWFSGLRL